MRYETGCSEDEKTSNMLDQLFDDKTSPVAVSVNLVSEPCLDLRHLYMK